MLELMPYSTLPSYVGELAEFLKRQESRRYAAPPAPSPPAPPEPGEDDEIPNVAW
jgi:hypothetical protein